MLRRVSFGPFTLDEDRRQLLAGPDQEPVHLSPKAYELLCVLVETRPRAVSKRELHDRLWPSTFVSDATLASLVGELRQALGQRGRDARFIRTVHAYGYAFAADAQQTDESAGLPINTWIVCNGRETPLAQGEHVIGRDPMVTISLTSPTVSRHHARIVIRADGATLEDLGSKNGTYLRGQTVTARAQLIDGDEIRIGVFMLTFRAVTGLGSTETQAR